MLYRFVLHLLEHFQQLFANQSNFNMILMIVVTGPPEESNNLLVVEVKGYF